MLIPFTIVGNFDVEKTIVVPDSGGSGNNFLAGMLASACQSKGLDANAVMALCGNRNGSFGNGWDGIIALIVIANKWIYSAAWESLT